MAKPPPRLFTDEPLEGGAVALTKAQAHYLGTVLRLGEGAGILLFDGRNGEWAAEIGGLSRNGGHAVLTEQTRKQASGRDLTLLFAPLKKGPTDLVIRMGTELGVRHFQPVLTDRTQADRVKTERLASIAMEAAEQCERLDVPTVAEPARLFDAADACGHIMFCDEAGEVPSQRWGGGTGRARSVTSGLADQPPDRPWAVLIGPEGGFTPDERDRLRAREQTVAVSLGPRILKAETAAVAALTLWQSALGDFHDVGW